MKNRIIKNLNVLVITATLNITVISAQSAHEFSIYGGSGLSTLRYQISPGESSGSMGADFGLGYTYFRGKEHVNDTEKVSREKWGIRTGIGLGWYNSNAKLDNEKITTKNLRDSENDLFDLHTTLSEYKETQKTMFLNIPVMALFQIDRYYVMGGIKAGIPLIGKYKSKDATLTNKAYYHDLDNWAETQEFAGYGRFRNSSDGKLELGISVMLAIEAGMKWRMSNSLWLYTGVYMDYGVNNTSKNSHLPLINYTSENPANFTTNSVLSSFTDKAKIMAVGIKVGLALRK
jgi:hypothetical protein